MPYLIADEDLETLERQIILTIAGTLEQAHQAGLANTGQVNLVIEAGAGIIISIFKDYLSGRIEPAADSS